MQRDAELNRSEMTVWQRRIFSWALNPLQRGVALGGQIQGPRRDVQARDRKTGLQPRSRRFAAAAAQIQHSSARS